MFFKGINPSQEGSSKTPRRARYSDFSFQRPKPEDPPRTIYNLGCQDLSPFDFSRPILWQRMPTALRKVASSIPVFLVNSWQMDAIYPPSRKTILVDETILKYCRKVATITLEVEDTHNPPQELWELFLLLLGRGKFFSGSQPGTYKPSFAMGLYLPKPPALQRILERSPENMGTGEGIRSPEEAKQVLQNHQGPVIFLCCERIYKTAESERMDPNLVLDMVYYHELGHALLDVEESLWDTSEDPYDVPFGRIIEESAANWIAYYCFTGKEAGLVQRLIRRQPVEYQGYAAFEEAPVIFLDEEKVFHHLLERNPRLIFSLLDKRSMSRSLRSIAQHFYWRRYFWLYQSWPAIWHAGPVINLRELGLHWAGQGATAISTRMSRHQPSAFYQTIQYKWSLESRPTVSSAEGIATLNILWWLAYKELGAPRERKGSYIFPLSFLVFAYYLLLRGAFT